MSISTSYEDVLEAKLGAERARVRELERECATLRADVRTLVQLGFELTNYISETDKSATGSIYGIEYAHKTLARIAAKQPPAPDPASALMDATFAALERKPNP